MKRNTVIIALGFLLSTPASAQISVGAHIGTLVDDNVFNNSLQTPDRLTEFSLQGAYDWETESTNTQIFYSGVMSYFSLLPSRSSQDHSSGMTYTRVFGDDEQMLVNAGGTFSIRRNRDEFTLYDHTQVSAYGNLRAFISDRITMKGSYSFRRVSFAELKEFNYTEHYVFAQAAVSLLEKTTAIFQADLGYKQYESSNADDAPRPGILQLIGSARFGQGITHGTGLSVAGQYQLSLQKESRYLTSSDGLLTDDELFDDHYGYDGPLASLMLTQLFAAEFHGKVMGTVQRRMYTGRPAFDLAGQEVSSQRNDIRSVFSASVNKVFPALGLVLTLTYDYIVNQSNDAYYGYTNNALSARLSFAF